jgi:hypothetical protein
MKSTDYAESRCAPALAGIAFTLQKLSQVYCSLKFEYGIAKAEHLLLKDDWTEDDWKEIEGSNAGRNRGCHSSSSSSSSQGLLNGGLTALVDAETVNVKFKSLFPQLGSLIDVQSSSVLSANQFNSTDDDGQKTESLQKNPAGSAGEAGEANSLVIAQSSPNGGADVNTDSANNTGSAKNPVDTNKNPVDNTQQDTATLYNPHSSLSTIPTLLLDKAIEAYHKSLSLDQSTFKILGDYYDSPILFKDFSNRATLTKDFNLIIYKSRCISSIIYLSDHDN